MICEHGVCKRSCKICRDGGGFCIHDIIKSICPSCNGSALCKSRIEKNSECCKRGNKTYGHYCVSCFISYFPDDDRAIPKLKAKQTHCEHGKQKSRCKECNGSQICQHLRRKSTCKECNGSEICQHSKVKSRCKDCNGSEICQHNKYKSQCPDCDGLRICKSRREPYNTGCRQIGNRKYSGFCAHCFSNIFPNDPKTASIRLKSKELKVVNYISTK